MFTSSKKLFTSCITLVLGLSFVYTPVSAVALTIDQINAIISLVRSFGVDESVIKNVDDSLNGRTPTVTVDTNVQPVAFCYNWNKDLTVGSGGDDVKALNEALSQEDISDRIASEVNHFDENTAGHMVAFQKKYGIRQTGYVGPMTRAKLNRLYGCKVSIQPPPPVTAPITFLNPKEGEVVPLGKPYQINWVGFWSGNDVFDITEFALNGKDLLATNITQAAAGCEGYGKGVCSYMWTPNVASSNFSLSVTDQRGTGSAGYSGRFAVGNPTSNRPPVISGVDAPTTLKANETGTWTVRASDPENGALSYSVSWGDRKSSVGTPGFSGPDMVIPQFQQTATFTHSYASAGTFTPIFIVYDNAGQTAQTSVTVRVEDVSVQPSITVLLPNGGETWAKGTTQTIKWQHPFPTPPPCPATGSCPVTAAPYRVYDLKLAPYYSPCTGSICPAYAYRAPYTIAKGVYGASYEWGVGKILDDLETGFAPAGAYTVRVCQSGTEVCDSSDNYFKITTPTTAASKPLVCGTYGDFNADGAISQVDIDLLRAHILQTKYLSEKAQTNADLNNDGNITTLDITYITGYLSGTQSTFPVCAVVQPQPSLTVTSPNGGSFQTGTLQKIQWSVSNINFDRIQISVGSPSPFSERQLYDRVSQIDYLSNTATSFDWNVPSSLTSDFNSTSFYIKISALKSDSAGYQVVATAKSPTFTITAPVTAPSKPLVCGSIGDVNADGVISLADNDLARTFILGTAVPTDAQKTAADVNKSGAITSLDLSLVNAYILGTVNTFGACSTATSTESSLSASALESAWSALGH